MASTSQYPASALALAAVVGAAVGAATTAAIIYSKGNPITPDDGHTTPINPGN